MPKKIKLSSEIRNYFLFLVSIVVLFMAGSHLLDIGDIAGDLSLTNGYFNIEASRVYHIGFYLLYASFMILVASNIVIYIKYKFHRGV